MVVVVGCGWVGGGQGAATRALEALRHAAAARAAAAAALAAASTASCCKQRPNVLNPCSTAPRSAKPCSITPRSNLLKRTRAHGARSHAQVIDAITRHLELGSFLSWPEEQRTAWLLEQLEGRRPLMPPGMDLSPDEQEVVETFR